MRQQTPPRAGRLASRLHAVLLFVPVLGACLAAGCASEEKFAGPSSVFADVEDFDASGDKPPRAKTLHALARILADRGQENQSRYVLARAIKEEPRYLPAYTELAEIYVRNGRLNDAVTVLSTGLKEAPGDPVLLNDLGMCALLKGDSEKALEHFSQAAAAVPGDAKYRANMALAAGMMGRYADALSIYKELLPAEDAHYNLAVICEARNDAERAALEYQLAEAEE